MADTIQDLMKFANSHSSENDFLNDTGNILKNFYYNFDNWKLLVQSRLEGFPDTQHKKNYRRKLLLFGSMLIAIGYQGEIANVL